MICQKCGFENTPGDRLCAKCQNSLDFRALDSQMININDLKLIDEKEQESAEDKPVAKSGSWKKRAVLAVVLVAIAGIIAGVTWPVYDARMKAESISNILTSTKIKVETYARKHRSWPASANGIKLKMPASSRGEFDIKINHGIIELVISGEPGKKATFSPSLNDRGNITWDCQHGGIDQSYLPTLCAD
jgi:hypothetical protein